MDPAHRALERHVAAAADGRLASLVGRHGLDPVAVFGSAVAGGSASDLDPASGTTVRA